MSDGSFDELEALPHDEIEEKVKQLDRDLRSLDEEYNLLHQERRNQVEIVKSLRGAFDGIQDLNSERRVLLHEFHEIKKNADTHRLLRDKVNLSIPPPASVLEEWMAETYSKLTTIDNDLTAVPTINRELESFRRFFELQAAVIRKREAEDAHAKYVSHIEDLRRVTSKLDATRKAGEEAANSVLENNEVNPDKITRIEIKNMSKRISRIDKQLDTIKSQRRELRKEAGKVRTYQKLTSTRGEKIRLTDVKERASKGGSLNANELSALLDSGSLKGITSEASKPEPTKSNPPRKGRTGKKGMRRLGVTRAGPRKGDSASRRE